MLTAYDYPFARILDEAGIDVLLVGDTLGMVVQGLDTTLPVTVDEIIYHLKMVSAGAHARARGRRPAVPFVPGVDGGGAAQRRAHDEGRAAPRP